VRLLDVCKLTDVVDKVVSVMSTIPVSQCCVQMTPPATCQHAARLTNTLTVTEQTARLSLCVCLYTHQQTAERSIDQTALSSPSPLSFSLLAPTDKPHSTRGLDTGSHKVRSAFQSTTSPRQEGLTWYINLIISNSLRACICSRWRFTTQLSNMTRQSINDKF